MITLTLAQLREDAGVPSGRPVSLEDMVGANLRTWLDIEGVRYMVLQAGSAVYLYCPTTGKAWRQPMVIADWLIPALEAM